MTEEKDVSCCYARSDKYWVQDPAGVPWESFHSLGSVPFFHGEVKEAAPACCGSAPEAQPGSRAQPKATCCS